MNNNYIQSEFPIQVHNHFEVLPDDLFIPPNALEVCLESFSGPLDLLLYLIKKDNINILDLDISHITDQYLEYIELMDALKFDLAADYLVMAATLAEIKSRLMLPKESFEDEEEDPRSSLIKRLQDYQRYKTVSEKLSFLPRVDRDFFIASVSLPKIEHEKNEETLFTKEELFETIKDVLTRPNFKNNHLIDYEELSTKERIQILLSLLKKTNIISFSKTLKQSEGKKGAVVTLLASLELAKEGHVELVQNNSEELFLKSLRSTSIE